MILGQDLQPLFISNCKGGRRVYGTKTNVEMELLIQARYLIFSNYIDCSLSTCKYAFFWRGGGGKSLVSPPLIGFNICYPTNLYSRLFNCYRKPIAGSLVLFYSFSRRSKFLFNVDISPQVYSNPSKRCPNLMNLSRVSNPLKTGFN